MQCSCNMKSANIYMRFICDLAKKILRRACLLHQKCFALFGLEWSQKILIVVHSLFMSDVQLPKRRMCWCFVPLDQTRFWNWLVVVVLPFEERSAEVWDSCKPLYTNVSGFLGAQIMNYCLPDKWQTDNIGAQDLKKYTNNNARSYNKKNARKKDNK